LQLDERKTDKERKVKEREEIKKKAIGYRLGASRTSHGSKLKPLQIFLLNQPKAAPSSPCPLRRGIRRSICNTWNIWNIWNIWNSLYSYSLQAIYLTASERPVSVVSYRLQAKGYLSDSV